jgi:glycosyltransferase involved in cell wall biosynthesis
MTKTLHFISRRRLPNYHSIEELFLSIQKALQPSFTSHWIELPYSGASPMSIIKNLSAEKPRKNTIYHITGDVHYMGIRLGKRAVLTIHDVGSVTSKQGWLGRFYIKCFWFWLPALCVRKITVISEFTKQELLHIIPFKKKDIHVIHNPVNPVFQFSEKPFNTLKPKVLLMGTKPNKNLNRIFKALHGLSCELIIVGALNEVQTALLNSLNLNYHNKVKLTVSDIYNCYVECDMLCFPSLYEGFGMPIIEAQSVGRPVITSNLGAMKEVAGDGACLVDPCNVAAIRTGVLKVINRSDYRERLIQNGRQNVKRFTLEHIAQQYQTLYKQMAAS